MQENRELLPVGLCLVGNLERLLINYEQNYDEFINSYLPAILIIPYGVQVDDTGGNKTIVNQLYDFKIQFVYSSPGVVADYEEELLTAINHAENLASMLVGDNNLQGQEPGKETYLYLSDNTDETAPVTEAQILQTEVSQVIYNQIASTLIMDILGGKRSQKSTPTKNIIVCDMEYSVLVRTLYRKGGYRND